jgi:hypothetical protein
VSADLHYRFPPARAYRLNRLLFQIKSDAAVRARYGTDPEAVMADAGLGDAERAALRAGDRDGLLGLGAHAYLVFMAELRRRMDRGDATFEYF